MIFVVASEEGSTMMIDGEVIVKVENMHVDTPSAAVAEVIKTAG